MMPRFRLERGIVMSAHVHVSRRRVYHRIPVEHAVTHRTALRSPSPARGILLAIVIGAILWTGIIWGVIKLVGLLG